jgi:phosphoribosylaminoimidazole carboxylase (NCAIR synthetase)
MNQHFILSGIDYTQFMDDLRCMLRTEVDQILRSTTVPSVDDQRLYTVKEVSEILDVSQQTVHFYKKNGQLKYRKIGARTYFLREDITAALQTYQRTNKSGRSHGNR